MAKTPLIMAAGAAFFMGLGAGYLAFSPSQSTSTLPAPEQLQVNSEADKDNSLVQPVSAQPRNEAETPTVQSTSAMVLNQQQVEQQEELTRLRTELSVAKAQLKNLRGALQDPSDMVAEMQQRFSEQQRDEKWAYITETQANDFLYNAGLADLVLLSEVECKSTICRMEFLPHQGIELNPKEDWANIQTQLHSQPWWQQFKRSNARSSNDSLRLWVER